MIRRSLFGRRREVILTPPSWHLSLCALGLLLVTFGQVLVASSRLPHPPPPEAAAAATASPDASPAPARLAGGPGAPAPGPTASATTRRDDRAERGRSGPDISAFRGLGAWVDVHDLEGLRPGPAIRDMKAKGVRTLYLQTGNFRRRGLDPRVGPWLVEGHRAGMKVVGWYLPSYEPRLFEREVRRTTAIRRWSYRGHRFDGLGIDIEYRGGVASGSVWNRQVVRHAVAVRKVVGPNFPVAAITIAPAQVKAAPGYWAGFPWGRLANVSDVIMTMSYWSERRECRASRPVCAYRLTLDDVRTARAWTGDRVPVHIIGGIGDRIGVREVHDFVRAAKRAGAFGASLYDYATTDGSFWRHLSHLRTL